MCSCVLYLDVEVCVVSVIRLVGRSSENCFVQGGTREPDDDNDRIGIGLVRGLLGGIRKQRKGMSFRRKERSKATFLLRHRKD